MIKEIQIVETVQADPGTTNTGPDHGPARALS